MSLKVSQPRRGAFISYARADGESAARALHGRLGVDAPDIRHGWTATTSKAASAGGIRSSRSSNGPSSSCS